MSKGFFLLGSVTLSLEGQPIVNLIFFFAEPMPVREIPMDVVLPPPPPAKCKQPGVTHSLLYNGSRFKGHQKSKGNQYDVEVILQVIKNYNPPTSIPLSALWLQI